MAAKFGITEDDQLVEGPFDEKGEADAVRRALEKTTVEEYGENHGYVIKTVRLCPDHDGELLYSCSYCFNEYGN